MNRFMRSRSVTAGVAAALAVVLLGGGVALAGHDSNTIHACISKSGVPRIVTSAAACLRGESYADWNKQGAPGQVGAPGADGAAGPAGPVGETGETGAPGPEGAAGPAGPVGETGSPGGDGADGLAGPVGARGETGAPGSAGLTGAPGPAGPAGPAGASLASIDDLTGMPCRVGELDEGVFEVTYAAAAASATRAMSFACKATTLFDLTVQPTAGGSIHGGPFACSDTQGCTRTFTPSAEVGLVPSAIDFYRFTGWTGACTGTNIPCTVTVDEAKTVGATFTKMGALSIDIYSQGNVGTHAPDVTIDAAVGGVPVEGWRDCGIETTLQTGMARCGFFLPVGTAVTLTATTDGGHLEWNGCDYGTGDPNGFGKTCQVTIKDAHYTFANLRVTP